VFPLGSVIVIDNFRGRYGDPKRRWFIYFGKFEYTEIMWHVICTTTSRKKKYTDGNRKDVPHLIIPSGCFKVDSVVDIGGVYTLTNEELEDYAPKKMCNLDGQLLEECRELLVNYGDIEDFVKDYLKSLRF